MRKEAKEGRIYANGQMIFEEGKPGGAAYIVQKGQVEIYKVIDGREVILGHVEPGGLFGEMALIDNEPRMASARAASRVLLISITRSQLDARLKKGDGFINALLRIMMTNYRTMARRLAEAEAKLKAHDISREF